ncbi:MULTISPECIES: voltage-gated chloride channel family protein [Paraliobacillus]|uniref:voltage-gated chloride channel family protein n=1 Tax=Paraliobacillus TaxID=200903 RepID=UPI000DD405C4
MHYIERFKNSFHFVSLIYLIKWICLASIVGTLAGAASAFFLVSLNWAATTRESYTYLLFFLPFAGAFVSFLYMRFGGSAIKGNNLILEEIRDRKEGIPLRMAPLVLFGTIMTHLFGGSAGREGTAVQMGSTFADFTGKIFRLDRIDRKIILIAGISAGFSSLFGTPLAGTVFGIEVLALGLVSYQALIPAFLASIVGDQVTRGFNVPHAHYIIDSIPAFSIIVVLKVIIASILFGLAAGLFSRLTGFFKKTFSNTFKNPMLKSFVGGTVIIILVYIMGTRDYLGLGLPLIEDSFNSEVNPLAFLWKIIYTSITLGAGFQGGEVTPLFAIGATLGNMLAGILNLPLGFLAALGFIAVFSGATNTPLACFIMGIELFGADAAIYLFLACIISYLFSGHTGIYSSQQIGTSKSRQLIKDEKRILSDL